MRVWGLCYSLLYAGAALFNIPGTILFASIALLLFSIQKLVIGAGQILRPELDSIVSGKDIQFLHQDAEKSHLEILTAFVVNGNVTEQRIQEMFQQRIVNLKYSHGKLVYKRLFQYCSRFSGYAFWKTDEDFNVGNHIREYDHHKSGLPIPKDESTLKAIMPKLAELPWKKNRSHWEALIVPSFEYNSSKPISSPCSLMMFRFDHLLLDGLSLIGFFREFFQSQFSIPQPRRNLNKLTVWKQAKLWTYFPFHILKTFQIILKGRYLRKRKTEDPIVYDVTEIIPVGLIKKVKSIYDVDFASVVHSSINASICKVLNGCGTEVPPTIDVMYILPYHEHPGGMCNYSNAVIQDFPLQTKTSLERLHRTDEILKYYSKDERVLVFTYFLEIIGMLPAPVSVKLISLLYTLWPSYIISVLPTTTSKEYVDDGEIVDIFYFTTPNKDLGLCVTAWGVSNQQRFSFLLKESIFGSGSNTGHLSASFKEELEKLQTPTLADQH